MIRLRDPNDVDAYNEFFNRYARLILTWCKKWYPHEPEDAAQEVLLKLIKTMRTDAYDSEKGPFRPWLSRVVRNLMFSLIRKARLPLLPPGNPETREQLERTEAGLDLQQRIETLFDLELLEEAKRKVRARVEPITWASFVETAENGRKPAEVARQLGVPVASVSQAKYKIIRMLKEEVDGCKG